jgi:hypothetical protein
LGWARRWLLVLTVKVTLLAVQFKLPEKHR